jgi:hypothetical protein
MSFPFRDIELHRKYLAEVPRDVVRRRLEFFRLSEDVMDVLPWICIADKISDKYAESQPWLHPLDPISLFDLKNWFGVPNEVARQQLNATRTLSAGGQMWGRLSRVSVRNLPKVRSFKFESLDPEQMDSVKQMASNLLHGYVDPEEMNLPPISGVVDYMLEQTRARNPKIFVAPDLIVCPDDKIEIQNIPAMLFNNILIYGDGEIISKSYIKIHAYQIRHVNA